MSRSTKDKYDGIDGLTELQKDALRKRDAADKLGSMCVSAINRVREDPHNGELIGGLISAVNAFLETSGSPERLSPSEGVAVHTQPVAPAKPSSRSVPAARRPID